MAESIEQEVPITEEAPITEGASDADAGAPDIHTTAGKLEDLHRREADALHAGSERAVEKRHAQGRSAFPRRCLRNRLGHAPSLAARTEAGGRETGA